MGAISNSSPLILYARIERLDILQRLFEEVIVPEAVHREVVAAGAGRPGANEVESVDWIRAQSIADRRTRDQLLVLMQEGEAEVITLALELGPGTLVLLDDARARRVARDRGLPVLGSAGILGLAKRSGVLPLVRPILEQLRAAGLYMTDDLCREVLRRSGEPIPENRR